MMLEIDSIDGYYGKSQVLHDISIESGVNEKVALLGRNGAGKTSVCRSVMGTIPRVDGEIWFDGSIISGLPPDQVSLRGIAWIPERRRVFPNLTVEENLEMGLRDEGRREEAFGEVFELFPRLEERTEQKAGTLSGGEQQMLAVGRAIVSDPRLILVDEPFEGLMPKLIDDLMDAFAKLREREIAMVIAGQKVNQILELGDRAYIIENGRIQYSGSTEEISEDTELKEQYLGVK